MSDKLAVSPHVPDLTQPGQGTVCDCTLHRLHHQAHLHLTEYVETDMSLLTRSRLLFVAVVLLARCSLAEPEANCHEGTNIGLGK